MTPGVLQAAVGCSAAAAEKFAGPLTEACDAYAINTPARLAAFLAQIGHESGSFRFTTEVWGPTPAQERYEGRADLGNTRPGDGERFKGHGLIQITGRHNHATTRNRLRARFGPDVPDFEADPEALAGPRWAALSAADYWDSRGLNALADAGNFELITRKINGGLNGQADRLARWDRAKIALGAAPTQHAPTTTPEVTMPIPALGLIGALMPLIVDKIPQLGKLFGSGSEVSERNLAAATIAVDIVKDAVGARNAQEAVEIISTNPGAAKVAVEAVEARWFELTEAGGGGIQGARAADALVMSNAGPWWQVFKSPSFIVACLLLPLVYIIVLSIVGVLGEATWSDDVRAAIAGTIVGSIVGGLVGYYYGQTTSRNRSTT